MTKEQVNIVCELCTEGTLFDLMVKYGGAINELQMVHILKDVAKALLHMHNQQPPIAHRDIKIENVLLHEKVFKLCDFGSACTSSLKNDGQTDVDLEFEEFEKYTTLMYRPPEMIDKYKKWDVTTKVDIWMLGCVAFTLVCGTHPFAEEQKLSIINAHYFFPADKPLSQKLKDFRRWMLTPEPAQRPTILNELAVLDNWANVPKINLP